MERTLRKKLPGGEFKGVSPERSKAMSAVRGRGNKTTETCFRLALVRASIKGWKVRPKGILGSPDFFFPQGKLLVFADGCFWHGCMKCGHIPQTHGAFWKAKIERNRQRDRQTTLILRGNGFKVLRFWEHEFTDDIQRCVARIKAVAPPNDDTS